MIYNRSLKDPYLDFKKPQDNLIPFALGRNAINYLVKNLNIKSIVLPSFICPMLPEIFSYHKIEIFYYDGLNEELKVPVNTIFSTLDKIKSKNQLFFLWHDYLNIIGDIPIDIYNYLEVNNIETIVDASHSLPNKKYKSPNVVFGFRKLVNQPFGAFLKTSNSNSSIQNTPINLKICLIFLNFRMKANLLFTFKFLDNKIANNILKKISNINHKLSFDNNSYYLHDSFQMPKLKFIHRKLDYHKISIKRQKNFLRYEEKLKDITKLNSIDTFSPYGFPLMTDDNQKIRKKLWDRGIHSFILWSLVQKDSACKKSETSDYLSKSVIILPVNHDLSIQDIDKVIEVINE